MALQFLKPSEIEELRKLFPIGCRIYCHTMNGEPAMMGRTGKLRSIDDAGQLHVAWEGAGTLALIPGLDVFWRDDLGEDGENNE